jgi:hypothetical protein
MPCFGKNARSPLSKQKDRTQKIDVLWNKMDARNGSVHLFTFTRTRSFAFWLLRKSRAEGSEYIGWPG